MKQALKLVQGTGSATLRHLLLRTPYFLLQIESSLHGVDIYKSYPSRLCYSAETKCGKETAAQVSYKGKLKPMSAIARVLLDCTE